MGLMHKSNMSDERRQVANWAQVKLPCWEVVAKKEKSYQLLLWNCLCLCGSNCVIM